jgi:ribosomal protein S7
MIYKFLIKKGKKTKAKRLVFEGFNKAQKVLKIRVFDLPKIIQKKLNTFVETKHMKIRRGRYFVPFPVGPKRRIYLASKWFLTAVLQNKQREPFVNKFAKEVISLVRKKKNSAAYKFKDENIKKALQNKSNVHYRW